MNGNHFELEQEMKRRHLNIERNSREAWKLQGENGKVNRDKRVKLRSPFWSGLLQMLRK